MHMEQDGHDHDHEDKGCCKIVINCGGKGHDKPCHCPRPEYAEVISQSDQTLSASVAPNQAGQTVLLETTIKATAGIDVSGAALTGRVVINRAGWYDVFTGMCGSLNPVESPLKVWTLSLFRNGVYVPGSTFANMTLSPEQKANEIVADVFVHFDAGDILELANTSDQAIELLAPTLGSMTQPNSAYLKLVLLEAD